MNNFEENIVLSNWSYSPLYESKRIAGILNKRIIEEINES